jgi:hypothetical protein
MILPGIKPQPAPFVPDKAALVHWEHSQLRSVRCLGSRRMNGNATLPTRKYRALIVYIAMMVVLAFIVAAGALIFRDRTAELPGQPSPHALDQSQ